VMIALEMGLEDEIMQRFGAAGSEAA